MKEYQYEDWTTPALEMTQSDADRLSAFFGTLPLLLIYFGICFAIILFFQCQLALYVCVTITQGFKAGFQCCKSFCCCHWENTCALACRAFCCCCKKFNKKHCQLEDRLCWCFCGCLCDDEKCGDKGALDDSEDEEDDGEHKLQNMKGKLIIVCEDMEVADSYIFSKLRI